MLFVFVIAVIVYLVSRMHCNSTSNCNVKHEVVLSVTKTRTFPPPESLESPLIAVLEVANEMICVLHATCGR